MTNIMIILEDTHTNNGHFQKIQNKCSPNIKIYALSYLIILKFIICMKYVFQL